MRAVVYRLELGVEKVSSVFEHLKIPEMLVRHVLEFLEHFRKGGSVVLESGGYVNIFTSVRPELLFFVLHDGLVFFLRF